MRYLLNNNETTLKDDLLGEDCMNNPTWIVFLPPLLVLIITAITKRLNLAFIISICVAAFIATSGSIDSMIHLIGTRTFSQVTDIDYIYLYIFLLVIGIFIVLLDRTGGARAFAHTFTKHLRSAKAAESASLLVSAVLFIDDYLSNLTVGYVMRPITDRFHIPRVKLAYLVHSISIPLIILMPISSWVAMLTGELSNAGIMTVAEHQKTSLTGMKIVADPFFVFLASIPFIFYSFLALASVFVVIRKRISFGPMHTYEHIAATTDNLFGTKTVPLKPEAKPVDLHRTRASLIDFCIPITILIATFILRILYTGNYYLFGGTNSFINAFKNSDNSFLGIFMAGVACLVSGLCLALQRKKISWQDLPPIIREGISMMLPSVIMLILAKILSTIVRIDLNAGSYLATIMSHILTPSLVPGIFFVVSTITAFLMGTSWGTIALLLPMATPIIIAFAHVSLPTTTALVPLLFPALGAIFSGAICGDQLSPLSQTSLMAATSSGIDPMTHAKTQIPYAIPAIIASICSFILSGILAMHGVHYFTNCLISLSVGLALCCAELFCIDYAVNHFRNK